ncbi:thioesterase family protein [soil metagenome]
MKVHVYERPVRFEDVDAAGIVFFARFFSYAHEAMESLFSGLDGGYVRLTMERRIGMPAVHVEADYKSPLRFGDVARISVTVPRIGNKSVVYRYELVRAKDDVLCAVIEHTCAVSDLVKMKSIPIPDDVRALLEEHLRAP